MEVWEGLVEVNINLFQFLAVKRSFVNLLWGLLASGHLHGKVVGGVGVVRLESLIFCSSEKGLERLVAC